MSLSAFRIDGIFARRQGKHGFIATKFRHACIGEYRTQCQRCQDRINYADNSTMRATKRIEWLKQEYRAERDLYRRQGILRTALEYMRERIAGKHSDWSTSYFTVKGYHGIVTVKVVD